MGVFAVVVAAGVNIQFFDPVAERKQLVPRAGRTDLADHDAKRIGWGEDASAQILAISFENGAYLLPHVARLAVGRMVEIREHITVGPVAILRGFIYVPFADRRVGLTDARQFKAFAICGLILEPVPDTLEKEHIVR